MMFRNPQDFALKAELLLDKDGPDKLTSGFVAFHRKLQSVSGGAYPAADTMLSAIFGQMQAMKVCAALAEAYASAERFDKELMRRRRAAIGPIQIDAADTPDKARMAATNRIIKVLTAELDDAGDRGSLPPLDVCERKARALSNTLIPVSAMMDNLWPHHFGSMALHMTSAPDTPFPAEIAAYGAYLRDVTSDYTRKECNRIASLDKDARAEALDALPVTVCGIYAKALQDALPEVEDGIKVAAAIWANFNSREPAKV